MFIPSVSQKAETVRQRLASQLTAFIRSTTATRGMRGGQIKSAAKPDVYAKAGFRFHFEDDDGEWLTYEDFRARQTGL